LIKKEKVLLMEEHQSQTQFVSNTSSRTILDTINDLFLKATRADCAVAYLSYRGWQLIRPMIMQWANNSDRKLRLLVRQDDQFPDNQAITERNQLILSVLLLQSVLLPAG
jgi:hypothetical protein